MNAENFIVSRRNRVLDSSQCTARVAFSPSRIRARQALFSDWGDRALLRSALCVHGFCFPRISPRWRSRVTVCSSTAGAWPRLRSPAMQKLWCRAALTWTWAAARWMLVGLSRSGKRTP